MTISKLFARVVASRMEQHCRAVMMGVFVDDLRRWLRGERLHNIVDPDLGYVRG
ncbi:hypothetical protein [Mycobacterium sp. EPa45]|uniref:hypothetical protein n=1 Tax=Mycobacterium sp. EPa45 TaxID=1545728 RepID=UPI00130E6269|nr:hypothetical protein [Mycobacterium sp. EPa45]